MTKLDEAVRAAINAYGDNCPHPVSIDAMRPAIQAAVKVLVPEESDIAHLDRLFLGYNACRAETLKNAGIEL